jgi:type IX secretion system PorP/SprF family membrane protein
MKAFIIIIGFVFCSHWIHAQQNEEIRFNFDNQYLRNPAALSMWNTLDIGAYYQKNFSAIDRAPTLMFAGIQYPVPYQNFTIGGAVQREEAGLISSLNLNLSSSYKLLNVLNKADYLALGVDFHFTQIGINHADIIATDPGDVLIGDDIEKAMSVNVGFGVYYNSWRLLNKRHPKASVQLGLSAIKAVPQNVNLQSLSYGENLYVTGLVSARLPLTSLLVLRPMVDLMYENSALLNGIAHLQLLYDETFFVGASFDKFNALGFQLGFSLNSAGPGNSSYIITINTSIPVGQLDQYINNGVGIGLQYRLWDNQFTSF